jgi:hypothetical protein
MEGKNCIFIYVSLHLGLASIITNGGSDSTFNMDI